MIYPHLYQRSLTEPEEFWQEEAKKIHWFTFPEKILSKDNEGLDRWFEGGKLNTCYLALDYHVENGRGDQVAVYYDSPVTQTKTRYTYREVLHEVALLAGALKSSGVQKGDGVVIYMPMVPQAVFAMLACARIGAVHSVVFGGFAAQELTVRINDARPKLILMASGGKEMDKIIPYKPIVDQAIENAYFKPEACIVLQREFVSCTLQAGFDQDWSEWVADAKPASYEMMDALDPLYILYTSGTTGPPKGIVRDNGGHAVALHASMDYVYGAAPGTTFWAASDIGWVVGHSYIVYAPLIRGCSTVIFEGKPVKTPDPGTFWRMMEEYRINTFFTAPTAIRAIKKEDPDGLFYKKYDTSGLKTIFLAGERTDTATFEWLTKLIQRPVIDHWWQTESGYPMLTNFIGLSPFAPRAGSAGKPMFGFDIRIMSEEHEILPAGKE